jgi:hypothetical protein
MRIVSTAALLVLAFPCAIESRAGEKEEAITLLESAVKAHGGADKLAKASRIIRKGTGVVTAFGKDMPFTDDLQAVLPNQLYFRVEAGTPPNTARLAFIINLDKGWQDNGGVFSELPDDRVKEMLEEAHVLEAMILVPLLKDSGNQFSLLAEDKVNESPAVGILIKNKAHTDLKLYFDKKDHRLVRIGRHAKEAGVDVDKEYYYAEHKEVDGILMPFKIVEKINGRKYTELNVSSFKFPDKIDASVFKQPK